MIQLTTQQQTALEALQSFIGGAYKSLLAGDTL